MKKRKTTSPPAKPKRRVTVYKRDRTAIYMPTDLQDRLDDVATSCVAPSRSQLINGLLRHCLDHMTLRAINNVLRQQMIARLSDDTPSVFD